MGNSAPSAGAKRPGFTLIELLVAMTLVAVIAGGMTLAFSTSLRAAGTIQERAELSDERRALVARIRADLQGVWVRPGSETTWFRGIDGAGGGSLGASAEGDALELTTTRTVAPEILLSDPAAEPPSRPQSDIAQVLWQLEPDVDGVLALVRRERTPPDPELDITQDAAVVPTVYSRLVTALNLRFFDGVEWLDQWDPVGTETAGEEAPLPATLPRAVEVALFTGETEGRRRGEEQEPWLTLVIALPGSEDAALPVAETGLEATGPEGEAP
jgi:prepilin-type N-terminal cleavage/methylation domain-containing protein